MSYILDALKKSQVEQNPDGIALAINRSDKKKSRPRGLLAAVVVLVLTNIGLLLWVTLSRPAITNSANVSHNTDQSPDAAITQSIPVPDNTLVQKTTPIAATPTAEPAARPRPQARTPAATAVKSVKLSDLPVSEQNKFNSFNYSSHIYTDEPELCAIVINGERLTAGDRFEGLEVVAITEDGVIFGTQSTSNRGQAEKLHVAVSVIEQWER